MHVKIIGKNIVVTKGIREYTEKRLKVLEKYNIISKDDTAHVLVRTYPVGQKIEVTIPTKRAVLRAEATAENLYTSIDLVTDKLADQLRRVKTRAQRYGHKHSKRPAELFPENASDIFVKTKTIQLEKMDVDEAIMRMELLGHDFFVYIDDETEKTAVVYKRHKSEYGLIETE